MKEYALREGWTVVEELVEPGETATNTDRPVLQDLLKRIREGALRVDGVLAHKLNRMARNLDDYIPLRALLKKHGVRLLYVVERIDNTPAGRLLENMMASVAEFESSNLSEETKKGMRQKVLNGGWPHRPPRGYVSVRHLNERPLRSHCEIHPREGSLVARAFELFAAGQLSIKAIAGRLYRDGLQSATGTALAPSLLQKMLTNPFYIGRIRWKDLDVAGEHPPLIDPSLFHRVQEVFRERSVSPLTRRRTVGFPLKGLAICSRCRGHLTAEQHGRHGYYRCNRQANSRSACDARYCRADRAEADIERILRTLQITRHTARQIEQQAHELIEQRTQTARNRAADAQKVAAATVSSLGALTELFIDGSLSSDEFRRRSYNTQEQQRQFEERLKALALPPDVLQQRVSQLLAFATSLWDLYVHIHEWRRSDLLRIVFASVVVGGDGVMGFTLRPPFDTMTSGTTSDVTDAIIQAAA